MYAPDGTTSFHIPWISFLSGNVSLPRQVFEQVQGFDERFVGWGFEHFEIGLRLCQAGLQFVHEPRARSFHFAHRRGLDFYRSNLGTSYEYLRAKHPGREVELLRDFMRGKISLQEFETLVHGEVPEAGNQGPVYFALPVDF
jgi:hypothetical protein